MRRASALHSRFVLETLDEGGVLVDLETGTYFEVNGTAAVACEVLLASGHEHEAAARLGERLSIGAERAQALVESVLEDLAAPPDVPEDLAGPFRYLRDGDVYQLHDRGLPVLQVDPRVSLITLCGPASSLRFGMLEYVRAVTPKVMGLLGVTVLHASACNGSGGALAFSGPSGAGKTTTMQAFAAEGAGAISEDLLVLTDEPAEATCYLEGEANAHAWSAEAAKRLSRDGRVPFDGVTDAASGPRGTVDRIWFVDARRRRGSSLEIKPLGQVSGFLSLLRNTFLGRADAPSWIRHLRTVRRIRSSLSLFDATVPQGIPSLAEGVRRYVTNSAS
jgi:hypothetical protein